MDYTTLGHFWPPHYGDDTSSHSDKPRHQQAPREPADTLADLSAATTYWRVIATGDACYDCFQQLLADAAMIVTNADLADVDRQHRIYLIAARRRHRELVALNGGKG